MGFIPKFLWEPERGGMRTEQILFHPGWLGGYIVINWPHNILWIIIGVGGLVAAGSYVSSKMFSQGLFLAAIAMTLVGFLPLGIGSLWGVLPLSGWNIMIHALTAMLAWYYGFVYTYGRELHQPQ
jgi:hypothetical protein